MDSKEIRELVELISRSNFASFELEREGFKLKLVKQPQAAPAAPGERPALEPAPARAAVPAESEPPPAEPGGGNGLVEMPSPIIGTFYVSPSPDAPPFVEVGTHVSKGQVMCIVEAMKVMNEIESEIDAEVAEILVANGQPVEYGTVLFRLRPAD